MAKAGTWGDCGGITKAFTGVECVNSLGQLEKIAFVEKDFEFASADEVYSLDVWNTGIASGKIIVIPKIKTYEDTSAESILSEKGGRNNKVKNGEYRYAMEIKSNQTVYHQIQKLEQRSFDFYNVFLIDSKGKVFAEETENQGFKGIEYNSFFVNKPPLFSTYEDTEVYQVTLNLEGDTFAQDVGNNIGYVRGGTIRAKDVKGIVATTIEDSTDITAGSGEVVVEVLSKHIGSAISGLVVENFLVNNIQPTTVLEDVTFKGNYTLTTTETGTVEVEQVASSTLLYEAEESTQSTVGT